LVCLLPPCNHIKKLLNAIVDFNESCVFDVYEVVALLQWPHMAFVDITMFSLNVFVQATVFRHKATLRSHHQSDLSVTQVSK